MPGGCEPKQGSRRIAFVLLLGSRFEVFGILVDWSSFQDQAHLKAIATKILKFLSNLFVLLQVIIIIFPILPIKLIVPFVCV